MAKIDHRLRADKLHVVAKNVSHALMAFTPGGSEYFTRIKIGDWEDYYADADVCQQRVRERITKAEESSREYFRAAQHMRAALIETRKIVSEAAATGFNCHDGDWAERLFANQAKLSNAIARIEDQS